MEEESGEHRDFLPDLVRSLDRAGAGEIVLEEGYGGGMDIRPGRYLDASGRARFGSRTECFAQDIVMILRYPSGAALRLMRPGAVLLSMVHARTRGERLLELAELDLHAVGLDAIVDDRGRRIVENLEAVGWNGVRAAFAEIRRRHPHFDHPSRRPLRVTCLGSGAVGGHAVHAATRYGDPELRKVLVSSDVPGVEVTVVDFDLTWHHDYMLGRLELTDLLIDATQRKSPAYPVIPNEWLAATSDDAVVLDLAADPYDLEASPPVVKGIEGIPHGNLDHYVFPPDDPAWDAVDPRVDTTNRRVALSCYSWPGLDPVGSMRTYGEQLDRLVPVLLTKPPSEWDVEAASLEERALARGEVSRWVSMKAG